MAGWSSKCIRQHPCFKKHSIEKDLDGTLCETEPHYRHSMLLIFASQLQNKSTDAILNHNRRCKCDMTAIQRTVTKDGVNKGRVFWTCPNSEKARCGFFEWDDSQGSSEGGGRTTDSGQGGQPTGECFKVRLSLLTIKFIQLKTSSAENLVTGAMVWSVDHCK